MRFLAADINSIKGNPPLLRRNNAHDAPERCGLACSVSPQEGNQLSLLYLGRDSLEDMTFPIIGVDVLKKKHSNPSQISLLDLLVVRDLRGGPFCQDTSLVQNRNDI